MKHEENENTLSFLKSSEWGLCQNSPQRQHCGHLRWRELGRFSRRCDNPPDLEVGFCCAGGGLLHESGKCACRASPTCGAHKMERQGVSLGMCGLVRSAKRGDESDFSILFPIFSENPKASIFRFSDNFENKNILRDQNPDLRKIGKSPIWDFSKKSRHFTIPSPGLWLAASPSLLLSRPLSSIMRTTPRISSIQHHSCPRSHRAKTSKESPFPKAVTFLHDLAARAGAS